MNKKDAEQIINWHYDGIYSFYDMKREEKTVREFLDESTWGYKVFSVYAEQEELVGLFTMDYMEETNEVIFGLGLKPDLTGKGIGLQFVKQCIEYIKKVHSTSEIVLFVATFNLRAIKVYQRAGFITQQAVIYEIGEKNYPFLQMKLEPNGKAE